jgi:hypothetical protein
MQPQAALPSEGYVWSVLGPRLSAGLKDRAWELWRHSGLDEEYGPLGENFTGERETQEMSDEIAGYLVNAIALDTQAR